jgi:protein translocase SecG subunit
MNMSFAEIMPYVQIILSVLLIGGILLQRSEAGLGGAFGGDNFTSAKYTKRGAEKVVFIITIVLAVLFTASSLAVLLF